MKIEAIFSEDEYLAIHGWGDHIIKARSWRLMWRVFTTLDGSETWRWDRHEIYSRSLFVFKMEFLPYGPVDLARSTVRRSFCRQFLR